MILWLVNCIVVLANRRQYVNYLEGVQIVTKKNKGFDSE